MSTAPKFNPHYTLEDYHQWEGDWELWFGTAVSMAPSPFGKHGSVAGRIITALTNGIDQSECNATLISEVDWIVSNDTVVRPDISVVCGKAPAKHQESVPTLIAEVLSEATRERDVDYKRRLYEQNAVPWYLIADPDAETLVSLRLDDAGKYQEIDAADRIEIDLCGDCIVDVDLTRLWR